MKYRRATMEYEMGVGKGFRFSWLGSGWATLIVALLCLGGLDHLGWAGSSGSPVDLDGKAIDPLVTSRAKATVLFFLKPDCPISNRYAPEIGRLHARFGKDVTFWLVYPDVDLAPDEIRKHIHEFKYPGNPVRDPAHRLVEFCLAKVTPEAAVISSDGHLAYHGRIDNRHVAFGRSRPEATHRDLELAIESVLQGRPVPPGEPAVGCAIAPVE